MRQSPIKQFRGKYFFLSNFFATPVEYDGIEYPTAEHAYQAQKTLDVHVRTFISEVPTPGHAKQYGSSLDLREDWSEELALKVMKEIVLAKFEQNKTLGRKLVWTSPCPITEGNTWGDTFWGVCEGEGENHMGRILTEVRRELRAHQLN